MEELTSTAGGGPLPIVLSLMLSAQAGLELTTHQDLLQLAGNIVAGQYPLCFSPGSWCQSGNMNVKTIEKYWELEYF